MNDLISRQAAIDALRNAENHAFNSYYKGLVKAHKIIADLPPVTPKPKTGHWVEGQTDNPNIHNIICSCCFSGYPSKGHANSQYTMEKFKYCPNCGEKMVEPNERSEKK